MVMKDSLNFPLRIYEEKNKNAHKHFFCGVDQFFITGPFDEPGVCSTLNT